MAAQQWWVIAFTSYGTPPSYEYFQGTKAQAEAKAKLAVEVSTSPAITGPFPTKAAAEASVKAGKANTPSPGDSGPHVGNPLKGLAAIGDFFARLTEANTWLRIGEACSA